MSFTPSNGLIAPPSHTPFCHFRRPSTVTNFNAITLICSTAWEKANEGNVPSKDTLMMDSLDGRMLLFSFAPSISLKASLSQGRCCRSKKRTSSFPDLGRNGQQCKFLFVYVEGDRSSPYGKPYLPNERQPISLSPVAS